MRYRFVDCRYVLGEPEAGRALYLAGHIPGAAFLDLDEDLSSPPGEGGRHPLPAADGFARAASRAGIGPGAFVVAYDQGMTGGGARLWWLLRHFGHDEVAVLDGGIEAWRGPLRTGEEEVEPAVFEARPRGRDTIEADELASRLGDGRLALVDARLPDRFSGESPGLDPVAGRIPGARNVPYTEAFPPPADLLAAEEIAVYCGSGVTACVNLLALALAGRPDARLYPGSWSEWCLREDLPLERDG